LATRLHTESPNCFIGATISFVILLDCKAAIIAIRKITTQNIFIKIAQTNHNDAHFNQLINHSLLFLLFSPISCENGPHVTLNLKITSLPCSSLIQGLKLIVSFSILNILLFH